MGRHRDSLRSARLAGAAALLLGLLCCLSIEDARRLLAEETARAATALPERGGVRELPTATSQAVPLANPDFEQQWDGWTPPDQEAFSIETQPGTAHSGQSCLRFDCGQQTRYVPSLRQKIGGIGSGVYVLRFWLKLDGVSVQTREATFRSRPVWMVIQFFQGWSTDRWPAEEELRTMSLMAITEGARGQFYWSYGARALMWVKDPQQREEYWRRLVSVTRELRSLEPALVASDAPQSVSLVSDRRIRWLARVAHGKCYVFAYLPAESFVEAPAAAERTEVRFTLADGQTVTRTFRPDSADWFAVPLQQTRRDTRS